MKTNPNDRIQAFLIDRIDGLKEPVHGLTKREYFAVMAMQGLSSWNHNGDTMLCDRISLYEKSVRMADGLIKELNKETK